MDTLKNKKTESDVRGKLGGETTRIEVGVDLITNIIFIEIY